MLFITLMTTIIVTNEFVQLNETLFLIWLYLKRPQDHPTQSARLGQSELY